MNGILPLLLFFVLLLTGCGESQAPAAVRPSPTIAVMVPSPQVLAPLPAVPLATLPPATPAPTRPPEAPFQYLWPAELPAGMQLRPGESRVAQPGEFGDGDTGFYLITFGDSARRLVVGGGSVEPFGISGATRVVQAGNLVGTLTEQGEQRQIILAGIEGNLFVYGLGVNADDLVRTAASLQPLTADEMRTRTAVP